ncbi:sodium-dependent transporter [Denitrobacterium detoxificans]|uniref:Transporter n=1 Tax=Denitrobacterium detoxificans TaxID=79604 RepID=A0A1H8QPX3_9ACTN|nr:sodium-dependent transporter [Denitrobacterium detoxificans]SEO56048.1 neurotransmitter:Na+ symporter, NSS family [Denitrobacterium detoxificans]
MEQHQAEEREHFASRLGFILVAAGCAIGLGNVWRFPYIAGQYGGGAFILIYVLFLVILGLPVMVMEFAVGRASQSSTARAFHILPSKRDFRWFSWWGYVGSMLLLMFYTTICGWMLAYIPRLASGEFTNAGVDAAAASFDALIADPVQLVLFMLLSVAVGVAVTIGGLRNGVERVSKFMMGALFVIMVALCVRAVTLPGADAGIAFYLQPDFSRLFAGDSLPEQLGTFGDAVYAAMGQAFFSLSVGMGGMAIFGSRIGKERSLTTEALSATGLDTLVAFMAGLIIFPACFAFGVSPDAGPSLVFVTLPIVFGSMPLGNVWGALFFVFMGFAALSTVIAVFETIVSWCMDRWGISRTRSVLCNGIALAVLSIPCALGFNVLSDVVVPGLGDISSVEDFIVSNNILPLGGIVFAVFCSTRLGWGWDRFIAEADAGEGIKFPPQLRLWCAWGIPVLMIIIFIMGYVPKISALLG